LKCDLAASLNQAPACLVRGATRDFRGASTA